MTQLVAKMPRSPPQTITRFFGVAAEDGEKDLGMRQVTRYADLLYGHQTARRTLEVANEARQFALYQRADAVRTIEIGSHNLFPAASVTLTVSAQLPSVRRLRCCHRA